MHEQLARAEAGVADLLQRRNDRWYPTFHIAAKAGWINDPNGLVFADGRYHVFFQHNPFSAEHASMHWGHVSSEDMVTWEREPIALAPSVEADRDGVFSGSAVVADDGTLVAYYTGHRWRNGVDEADGNLQVQCMATSHDGVTFEKQGVVVEGPPELPHFRDPKVWRMGETWYMVFGACSAENRGQVWLYTSNDMTTWTFDRILFEDPDPDAFMLECPDVFPLGDRWVLIYCPMGPKPDGYRARNQHNAGYVVGNWAPGEDFEQLTEFRPLDWGHQFYAPQTFEAPDGRRIMYGWMGAFDVPQPPQLTDGWTGQLTVARELALDADDHLRSFPIGEIDRLRQGTRDLGAFALDRHETELLLEDGPSVEIELEVDLAASTAERIGLQLHKTTDGHYTYVGYDDLARRVCVDRRDVAHGDRGYRSAPRPEGDLLSLRVLVDRGSVEVFVDGGREAVTSFSFPGNGPRAVELIAEAGTASILSLRVHRLGTIWDTPDH